MITTCVDVFVKEECIQDFIAATEKNHRGSVAEPDNFRFDIIQSNDNPCQATVLSVGSSCSWTTFDNFNATTTPGANPGCASYQGNDLWFRFDDDI